MHEPRWFYLEGETSTGPFTWQRIVDLSNAEIIGPNTLIWREGTDEWVSFLDATEPVIPSPIPPLLPPLPALPKDLDDNQSLDNASPITPAIVETPIPSIKTNSPTGKKIEDARKWSTDPVAPWRRYGARFLDTTVHGYLGLFVIGIVWYSLAPISADKVITFLSKPESRFFDVILTCFFAALVGGFVVGTTGYSLGKVIFGVKVVNNTNMHAIGIRKGLAREYRVLFEGMALAIPIVALFTLSAAYRNLKSNGSTNWDRGRYIVLHRPNGTLQYFMNGLGIVLIIMVFALNFIPA